MTQLSAVFDVLDDNPLENRRCCIYRRTEPPFSSLTDVIDPLQPLSRLGLSPNPLATVAYPRPKRLFAGSRERTWHMSWKKHHEVINMSK